MLAGNWRPAPLRLAALLALAAGCFCAPSTLRASCGDYVILDPVQSAQRTPANTPPTPALPQPHEPCHGPLCSGGSLPPLAPISVAPDTPEQWCDLIQRPVAAAPYGFNSISSVNQRAHRASRPVVYHPPRLVPVPFFLS
jgi:hypothetical protein